MTDRTIDAKVRKILELDEQIKVLSEEQDKLKDDIKAVMGETEEMKTKKYIITWVKYVTQRFDSKKFKELHPDMYNVFAKESESRKFNIKEA